MMETVVIATNLGRLKAYRVVETPVHGKKLDLVEALNFIDARTSYAEQMTDNLSRFPMGGGIDSTNQMSTYEAMREEIEVQRRLVKEIAGQIEAILQRERPTQWYFAAGSEIFQAVLDEIAPEYRDYLTRTVHSDLTKTPPTDVLRHFGRWSG